MEAKAILLFLLLSVVPAAGNETTNLPPQSTLQNVTPSFFTDVTITCTAYSSVYEWVSYTPDRTVIWSSDNNNNNTNPRKYNVGNGSTTLTIMKVDEPDAGSYCCANNSLVEVCSNVVVVGITGASVNPSGALSAGDVTTLSCILHYSTGSSTPMSNGQDPRVSISVRTNNGTNNLTGQAAVSEVVFGNWTIYRIRSVSFKWTVKEPKNETLKCEVYSTNPSYIRSHSLSIGYYDHETGFGVGLRPEYTTQLVTGIIVLLFFVIRENGRTM